MTTTPPEQPKQSINQTSTLDYLPGIPVEIPNQSKRGPSTAVIILIVSVFILLFLIFIAFALWLAQTQGPTIAAVRDMLIIALALESCIFGIVLMLLLIMMIRLVNMLEFEIKPILEKTNETVSTLRGTSVFVSENVVKPVTKVKVKAAGVSQAFRTLFGNPRKNIK
jgi:hypothetical protein